LQLRESLGRLEQFDRNANVAQSRLGQEESALNSVSNLLQRVRELSLQANNATQSIESRQLIAIEIRQQLEQLVQLANQEDGNGNHLFAGNQDGVSPVVRNGSSFAYRGDQGQRFIQIGEGRQIADSDSGAAVFFAIREGNGSFVTTAVTANTGSGLLSTGGVVDPSVWDQGQYTVRFIDPNNYEVLDSGATVISTGSFEPGDTIAFQGIEFSISGAPAAADEFTVAPSGYQSVFETIQRIAVALENGASGSTAITAQSNEINAGLLNIDQAIGNILSVRTVIGSRLAIIENQVDSNSSIELNFRSTLSAIEDLDFTEAISTLSIQASILEAAQQSFIRTQSLSLFNFL
jgi:flagellar hook-associated protein 3 FlgL